MLKNIGLVVLLISYGFIFYCLINQGVSLLKVYGTLAPKAKRVQGNSRNVITEFNYRGG